MHKIFATLVFFSLLLSCEGLRNKSSNNRIKSFNNPIELMYSPIKSNKKELPCDWLKHLKRQYKLCKEDPGIAETLTKARLYAITQCEAQFRYNRWNCSRKRKTFKNIYRETALLYAMASSALTFSIARSCAEGKLNNCQCAKDPNPKINVHAWQMNHCSDNVQYGKKFTKKFLQLRQKCDNDNELLRHNSLVGIETVANHVQEVCKCHGISGSCSMKICVKRMVKFETIGEMLKKKYFSALAVKSENKPVGTCWNRKERRGKLVYQFSSPPFCKSTIGRRCLDEANCATLCCGRGYFVVEKQRTEKCHCRWKNSCCTELKCNNCTVYYKEYICK